MLNLFSNLFQWDYLKCTFGLCIKGFSIYFFAILSPSMCIAQQAGDLDLTFSFDGMQTTSIGIDDDYGQALAIQTDGKIVVVGRTINSSYISDFAIVRYNPDGSLDNTFSGNGIQTTAIGNANDYALAVSIQDDGKIVAAGSSEIGTYYNFSLVRYNSNGSLDNTFSGDGIQTTAIGGSFSHGTSLSIQSDGKIIVAGYSHSGGFSGINFALARYNSDGSLDNTFSGDGIQTTWIGNGDDVGTSLAIQPDGKILLAGYSDNGTDSDFAIIRYNSDGSLDTSFNGDGIQTTDIAGKEDNCYSLLLQPDGKMLLAGRTWNGVNNDIGLVRYQSDGILDTSFSGDGVQTTAIGPYENQGHETTIQPDGKIILVGIYYNNGLNFDCAIVRYNQDGSLDNTFSGDGIQTTMIGSSHDYAEAVAIQTDGKILVAGSSANSSGFNFAIARYYSSLVTGINENHNIDLISTALFPNPFQHSTMLKISKVPEIVSNIEVYNSLGQMVHSQVISSTETILYLELPVGIYSYLLNDQKGTASVRGKMMIQ